MDLVMNKAKLHLGSKKAAFMVQVEKDAMFLAELNIMDYSLLVSRVFPQVQQKAPVSMSNNHIPC
jgi:Phosphatidylinositol-4-phosphate 5-Kinase